MAISNEDINAWFRLDKVEVKANPPSKPCSSTTRAALAKREKEKIQDEEQKVKTYYENLKQIMLNKIESSDEEDDRGLDDDFDSGESNVLNLVARTDDMEYVMPTHTSVFDTYDFTVNENPVLPILDHKEHIISTIENNPVTVIQGSTGSGKSTQVPQYILGKYASERRYCNIICTQPRRIAAMSVAKYVAEKRGWRVGTLVGYQIAMDKLISEDTRLTFVTTGVLLQKLIKMQNMNQYTHVILDEVHERDKDTDFCLLLVRTFLRSNSRNVKVILMSATLESKTFAGYFSEIIQVPSHVKKMKMPAPILNIDGEPHEVIEYFLESIFAIEGIDRCDLPCENDPRIGYNMYQLTSRLIAYFDQLEREEGKTERGTVLVFLPGMPEIQNMEDVLKKSGISDLAVVPLHSSISNIEQHNIFLKPDRGRRKIILATNIAESSITVPDIKFVIDFCLVKELVLDKTTNYQSLKLQWASKASLTQRKGRAGRVSEGRCFRLITEQFYVGLNNFSEPEIKRVPLESLVLYAKQMNVGTPTQVLSRALEPPDPDGIAKAVINLKEVGALTVTLNGEPDHHDGDLTQFGEILASLPVDIKVGKLLILGHVFGLLEECLIIAAALSLKPMFVQLYHDEGMISYKSKMSWADYSFSDCIAMLNAYREWLNRKNSGKFRNMEKPEREWCERNFIKRNVIKEISELVIELAGRLRSFNITAIKQFGNKYNTRQDKRNLLILKLVIAGAFYPYYFRWGIADEEQATRDMSGHNPLTTVMISGLPANPARYHHEISSLFSDCGEGKSIHFESSRAYLEFKCPPEAHRQGSTNTVLDAVYIALKKRHARNPLCIEISNDDVGVSVVSSFKGEHDGLLPAKLPGKGYHAVIVTEVDTPGHFWVQYCNEQSQEDVKQLMDDIRKATLCPVASKLPLSEITGQYCLAMYSVDRTYYRGYVKSINQDTAHVLFVDYGNQEYIPVDFVCILPAHLRKKNKQAFECYLAGVKPSISSQTGQSTWTKRDREEFKRMVIGKEMYLKVYSEVHGILRVELWDTNEPTDINMGELLIQKGVALACEETLQSKQSHHRLERYCVPENDPNKPKLQKQSTSLNWRNPSRNPARQRRVEKCVLKGPINPYEVSFHSITRSGGLRTAKIESDSVNSIVVDSEPQDGHERLMVASQVNLSSSGNVLLARNTTLLPNIHGLAHLVCLIFAPSAELRTDELKRQYTGALCGLGFCPSTGISLFPDHDIEVVFDCLITQHDIDQVNTVRHAINLTLSTESEWGKPAMKKIQEKARERLLDSILKPRSDVVPVPSVAAGWNQVPPEDVVLPNYCATGGDYPPLLPLLNGVAISHEVIRPSKPAERVMLLKRVEALERSAVKSDESQTLFCNLCHIYLGSPSELLLHVATTRHQTLKRKLKEELASEDPTIDAIPLTSSSPRKQD